MECSSKFVGSSPDVLKQLPLEISNLFPAHLTSRSGLDLDVVRIMRSDIARERAGENTSHDEGTVHVQPHSSTS